jgi:hypothetical protein
MYIYIIILDERMGAKIKIKGSSGQQVEER